MTVDEARRHLEARYGLAMIGVSDDEIARALAAAEPADDGFWPRCVDALPIDETSLFRDAPLWEWLGLHDLPRRVARALGGGAPVRALSLGCAGGQEAFSLALVLLDLLKQWGMPATAAPQYASVHGIDASAARIGSARQGLLSSWSVDRAGAPRWAHGHVAPDPDLPGHHRVSRAALALTRFDEGNLLEVSPSVVGACDLVFCRHVLIYFRPDRAAAALAGLAAALQPGAVLIVSPVEAHLLQGHPGVERVGPVGAWRARTSAAAEPAAIEGYLRPRPSPGPLSPVPTDLDRIAAHLQAGRAEAAAQLARAVAYAEPENAMARLLLGQALLSVDQPAGRRVLEGLKHELSGRDATAAVSSDSELTVGQLRQAVGHLLAPGDAR